MQRYYSMATLLQEERYVAHGFNHDTPVPKKQLSQWTRYTLYIRVCWIQATYEQQSRVSYDVPRCITHHPRTLDLAICICLRGALRL